MRSRIEASAPHSPASGPFLRRMVAGAPSAQPKGAASLRSDQPESPLLRNSLRGLESKSVREGLFERAEWSFRSSLNSTTAPCRNKYRHDTHRSMNMIVANNAGNHDFSATNECYNLTKQRC